MMKKTMIAVLALMLALTVLCTACVGSGSKAEAQPTEAPAEATEIPSVTPPPQDEKADDGIVSADDNKAPEQRSQGDWLASLSEEQRKVEEELIGATIEDLYAAIGEPSSAEYTTSCLVADGEDGLLQYDGFVVSTTRFPNGTEYVMGTE